MLYEITIKDFHMRDKQSGLKPFTVCEDRGFQKGDMVRYMSPSDEKYSPGEYPGLYEVMYVSTENQKEGYVVFSDRLIEEPKEAL